MILFIIIMGNSSKREEISEYFQENPIQINKSANMEYEPKIDSDLNLDLDIKESTGFDTKEPNNDFEIADEYNFERHKSLNMDYNNGLFKSYTFAEEKEIPEELKKFKNIFPCTLISNSKGDIESSNDCFEEIPLDQIQFRPENQFSAELLESNKKSSLITDNKVSFGISLLENEVGSEFKISNTQEYSSSSKMIIIKKKLYSISIKAENIFISDYYNDQLETIANDSTLDDNEKANELEKLFEKTGYYIPLRAYIGGLYTINCENKSEKEIKGLLASLNLDLKFSEIETKNGFERKRTFTKSNSFNMINRLKLGGDTNKKLDEWIESVDLEKAAIIEYSLFRTIEDFIDNDQKRLLREPLKIINIKYEKKREYINIIKDLKNNRGELHYFNISDTIRIGKHDKSNKNLICDDSESFDMKYKVFGSNEKKITKDFTPDIIVGIEIINQSENPSAAKFSFHNPILKSDINITFTSKKAMKFDINIYTMKKP